jgi:uncharacterized protein DUF4304
MTTAQEDFKHMMKASVVPALREMGFKGSGQSFHIPSDDYWVLIGFQKSVASDSTTLRFTINLSVSSKAGWVEARRERAFLPERPSPNTFYGSFIWQRRIGKLLPDHEDKWWTVSAESTTDQVGSEVVAAIRAYAMPAIQRQLEPSS